MRRYVTPPRKFYVYVYFRPWNGQPCYVGKGCDRRWRDHLLLGVNHYNKRFASIIAKAGRLSMEMPCVIIRAGLSHDEAVETEIAFIAALGRHLLVNATDGGEGVAGFRHSEKMKQAARVRGIGRGHTPEAIEKIRKVHVGKKRSAESCAKMSAAAKLRVTPELKAACAERARKGWSGDTTQHRANISAALKGRTFSPEWRAKLSHAARNRKQKQ